MTDLARIRAHLDAGHEVCPTDWNGFHAIDGGKPILRVAARIKDLKDEGYPVERTGTRNQCAVYTKVSGVASNPILDTSGADLKTTEAAPETPALFDMPSAYSPYDEEAA